MTLGTISAFHTSISCTATCPVATAGQPLDLVMIKGCETKHRRSAYPAF